MKASELELIARCAGGFEPTLARELKGLGIRRVRPLRGSVSFFGTQRDAYRACLWSRVATRIQLVLARVPAGDADALYSETVAFPWEKHVRDGATIAVRAHGTNASLRNTQFTALKVKDGICDRLREVRGSRPDVDGHNPDLAIDVALHDNRATLCLNLSGESLHRRGYRQEGVQTEAPLKETLAAGILLAAGWDTLAEQGAVLVDPMCGSGTFALEGALIAAGIAAGLLRSRWGFEGWIQHDRQLWDELLEEARALREGAYTAARIMAGDVDGGALEIARANAKRAGVADYVQFFGDDAARLAYHLKGLGRLPGMLVANPPYGIRLLEKGGLTEVNAALNAAVGALPRGWQVALVTPDLGVDTALGRVPEQVIACHNGPIEAWVRLYDTALPARSFAAVSLSGNQINVPIADEASAQFAGRLRKVAKERTRWARREQITCYRVYDADLPDYPVSVDLYEGEGVRGDRFLVVEERPRPRSVDVQRAGRHFADAVALASAILEVPSSHVVRKPWETDAAFARSARDDTGEKRLAWIKEGGLRFQIDLAGGVGRTLPLAQRTIRAAVGADAQGKRFANLFASANAATVFAACGGASSTVSVDASRERLDWVEAQLRANGVVGRSHRTACVDVLTWLEREARQHGRYDQVLCAPPVRLAGHGRNGRAWDIEADLDRLVALVAGVLAPGGSMLLVLPKEGTRPNEALLARHGLSCEDITHQMTPHDFERSDCLGRCLVINAS